jgi:hypothetical protein
VKRRKKKDEEYLLVASGEKEKGNISWAKESFIGINFRQASRKIGPQTVF